MSEVDISARQRGASWASITKLLDCIQELENKEALSHSDQLMIQRLQQRLATLDSEFQRYHISAIDLVEEEEELEREQSIFNDHNERIAVMSDRLEQLASSAKPTITAKTDSQQLLHKWLAHIERDL